MAYLGEEGNKKITVPYFGNKLVLDWEGDRRQQAKWLSTAGINMPRQFTDKKIEFPVIVKSFGAAGGSGYFYAKNKHDFSKKIKRFADKEYLIQEYVVGVNIYFHYFYSPLTKEIELLSIDRRYESNVDALGRIPLSGQKGMPVFLH